MRRLLAALDRHWFAPASLRDLAMVRIVAVGSELFLFLPPVARESIWLSEPGSDGAAFHPLPALKMLLLPLGWGVRPDTLLLQAVWFVAVVAGLAALVGLYARPSLLCFAAACTIQNAHAYSYQEIHHSEALMILALWILALGPCGEVASVDAVVFRLRCARRQMRFTPTAPGDDLSPYARWPLRTIQWLFVLVYLSAGCTKLSRGGLAWMNGSTLSYYVAQDGIARGRPLGVWLSGHPGLLGILSVGTILFELSFVLALVPALTPLYVASGIVLHAGIYVTQHAPFFEYLFLYSAFAESLRASVRRWLPRRELPRLHVVYDGLCPLCIRSMVLLDACDWMGRLVALDLEREWGEVARVAPDLEPERARQAMHVVGGDGRLHRGFFAFRALARSLPPLLVFVPLLYLPGAATIGPRVYALVAGNRGRHACREESCAV